MVPAALRSRLPALCVLSLTLVAGGCLPSRTVRTLEDAVIRDAQVWSGTVTIRGAVTVKKEGDLTILPGTEIRFERLDRDGDGIGDGELLVEGGLTAVGTPEAPILFTSAAPDPRPADWKYLYLDYARRAQLRHIVSEYAYSGVQVHFCKASLLDSEFRYNVDGVRFSTVNIEVAGNRIHDNVHGIRYEERRGSGQVHHNDIVANEIGIFAVTRCEDRTRFADNNIVSRQYNVKLGLEQGHDLAFPRNWWGSVEPETIAAGFFDRRADSTLGEVTAPEPLNAPVKPSERGNSLP
jgi:hypothetical protein